MKQSTLWHHAYSINGEGLLQTLNAMGIMTTVTVTIAI